MIIRPRKAKINKTIKNKYIKLIRKGSVLKMNKIVSTNTLFKTKMDYSKLNSIEKDKYIDMLTDEFLENANELMLSLKDK